MTRLILLAIALVFAYAACFYAYAQSPWQRLLPAPLARSHAFDMAARSAFAALLAFTALYEGYGIFALFACAMVCVPILVFLPGVRVRLPAVSLSSFSLSAWRGTDEAQTALGAKISAALLSALPLALLVAALYARAYAGDGAVYFFAMWLAALLFLVIANALFFVKNARTALILPALALAFFSSLYACTG